MARLLFREIRLPLIKMFPRAVFVSGISQCHVHQAEAGLEFEVEFLEVFLLAVELSWSLKL